MNAPTYAPGSEPQADAPTSTLYRVWLETVEDVLAEPQVPDARNIAYWLLRIGLRGGWKLDTDKFLRLEELAK